MTPGAKDEIYMRRCLELARKGLGLTRQNPLVGAVIVHNDRIIGEGYHNEYGGPHAEVVAINSVFEKHLLKESTIYVNLEPCSHQGKTPPCSLLIKDSGIKRVVIGCTDSNPLVSGKGISILKASGAEVSVGILENESRYLNRRFFTFQEKKRPYIILKWAESSDGFIDRDRELTSENKPTWITNHSSKMIVHKWRSEELSILAGTNTLNLDNPELNVREWPGINPLRIGLDKNGRLFEGLHIKDGSIPTIIFSSRNYMDSNKLRYISISNEIFDIGKILDELYKLQITSIFVEGGSKLIQSFINLGLWDESYVFFGNKKFSSGVKAPVLNFIPVEKIQIRETILYIYRKN